MWALAMSHMTASDRASFSCDMNFTSGAHINDTYALRPGIMRNQCRELAHGRTVGAALEVLVHLVLRHRNHASVRCELPRGQARVAELWYTYT